MQYTLKTLAAAAALTVAGIANAAPVTIATGESLNNLKLDGGTGALSFSSSLITALNVGKIVITEVAPATVNETVVTTPPFGSTRTGATATAPIGSVTLDDTTASVLKVSTSGGALLKADPLAGVSLGGTLAVTNIAVDLTTKRIYASITGNFTGVANNTYAAYDNTEITTKDNFYLWDYASLTGPTVVNAAGTYTNAITGLTITTDGYKHFVSALRLYELGASTLQGVTNFGSINSTINVSAVPEPSTYAMALAGLALVGVAARRARKA